mmetsp:Transcript_133640/g.415616  ORF Transcript_133640/g.415616 Transcript_133640/m.415616 type:complete len:297 (+) Transcript_133640:83-973(+)
MSRLPLLGLHLLLPLTAEALRVQSWHGPASHGQNVTLPPIPTLFCFCVARPSPVDVETLIAQLDMGMITRCDAYAVYSNVSAVQLLGAERVARLNLSSDGLAVNGSMDVAMDPTYHSALNAPIFHQVWQRIFREATYRKYDWTVKVDPDTAWLPDRLRWVLLTHPVGTFRGLGQSHPLSPRAAALGNGGSDCLDMLGPLMVINREAMGFMEALWHLVLGNNIPREDAMILNFMQWVCKCDEPEPRLLAAQECPLSKSVPCSEKVGVHLGLKRAAGLAVSAYALHACPASPDRAMTR